MCDRRECIGAMCMIHKFADKDIYTMSEEALSKLRLNTMGFIFLPSNLVKKREERLFMWLSQMGF